MYKLQENAFISHIFRTNVDSSYLTEKSEKIKRLICWKHEKKILKNFIIFLVVWFDVSIQLRHIDHYIEIITMKNLQKKYGNSTIGKVFHNIDNKESRCWVGD